MGSLLLILGLVVLLLVAARTIAFQQVEIADLNIECDTKADIMAEMGEINNQLYLDIQEIKEAYEDRTAVITYTQRALLVEIKNRKAAEETLDMVSEMVVSELE